MQTVNRIARPAHIFRMLLLALPVLLIACSPPPSASVQDKNWVNAKDLVTTSDRVITAKFVEEKLENIQLIDSVTGAIAGDIDVLFRQFEVFESLKGTSDRSDLLWIAFEPGRPGELVDGAGEIKSFVETETYVLFLKGRLRPLEYPTEFGPILWTGNGEPSIAELTGDNLEFRAERPYLDLVTREDRSLPDPLSAAPFTLTLEGAKDLAD